MRVFQISGELPSNSSRIGPKKRGVALILMAFSIVALCGMVGLAIDGGIMYFLKARLSQAVDAGCLAGARSLARGANDPDQRANAVIIATNFFNANFPAGFWGCTSINPVAVAPASDPTSKIRYVNLTASVSAPLYFLRVLGFNTTTLSASAQAARRDANIMIILDRSGSMSGAVSQLVSAADWFVGQFAQGRDKVGLVTFGGTYNLIKPTLTSIPTVLTSINTLNAGNVNGTTNHAQPLWVAYQALAEANESSALNAIVFFTDGQPNTITADFVTPCTGGKCNAAGSNLKNPTTCNNGSTGSGSNLIYNPVIGYALTNSGGGIAGLYNSIVAYPPYYPNSTPPSGPDSTYTAYVNTAYDSKDSNVVLSMKNSPSGCNFTSSLSSDFKQIPTVDYYGNATNPGTNKYKTVTLTSFNGTNLTAAAFNAADQAAQRMRTGTLNSVVPLIDTIALNTGQTPDSVYMKRLANANDPANIIYDSTKPTGIYVYASSTADLQGAFVQIASQILHLSM